jgi:CheY-like chemotaxis protein
MLKEVDAMPRVIFLDLNMPRKNGYEVLEEIRRDDKLKGFPVVIFSTTSNDTAITKTREMGAHLFVSKPRSYQGLKDAIETCVNMDWAHFSPASNNYFQCFT